MNTQPETLTGSFGPFPLSAIGQTVLLAGVVLKGHGKTEAILFPDEDLDDTDNVGVIWEKTAEWQAFLRQSDVVLTEVTALAPDGTIGKALIRKSQRLVEQGVSWQVYRRDGYKCRYCGKDDVPLTVDHLVTWEEGGPSTKENLVSACRTCNKRRGNLPYADWLQHQHYVKASKNLDPAVRAANAALVATLASIPRQPIRSR